MSDTLDPSSILQIGLGFMASKTLLSAVELGVFTQLAKGPATARDLGQALHLDPRGWYDFFDGLVSLGLLERDGDGERAAYRNTPLTAAFLDRESPTYVGGMLEMANGRLYRFWADLSDALRTGKPQNEVKHTGKGMFEEL